MSDSDLKLEYLMKILQIASSFTGSISTNKEAFFDRASRVSLKGLTVFNIRSSDFSVQAPKLISSATIYSGEVRDHYADLNTNGTDVHSIIQPEEVESSNYHSGKGKQIAEQVYKGSADFADMQIQRSSILGTLHYPEAETLQPVIYQGMSQRSSSRTRKVSVEVRDIVEFPVNKQKD